MALSETTLLTTKVMLLKLGNLQFLGPGALPIEDPTPLSPVFWINCSGRDVGGPNTRASGLQWLFTQFLSKSCFLVMSPVGEPTCTGREGSASIGDNEMLGKERRGGERG